MFPLLIPLALQGINYLTANSKEQQAKEGLKNLQKTPYPKYETGQSIYDQANQKATGLTPDEKAVAINQLNQRANSAYQRGVDLSPNMAVALNSAANYGSIQGQLGLVAQDARARRDNLAQLIGLIGGQSRLNTGAQIQHRNAMEQAYGNSAQQQAVNKSQFLQGAGGMVYGQMMHDDYMKNEAANRAAGLGGNNSWLQALLGKNNTGDGFGTPQENLMGTGKQIKTLPSDAVPFNTQNYNINYGIPQ